jgi:uncharacterized protein involved in outer membrane biogenesis
MKKTLVVLGSIIVVVLVVILVILFIIQKRTAPRGNEPPSLAMPVTGMSIDMFEGTVDLRNITLLNPADFAERTFVSIPEIYVDVDTGTLSSQKLKHFREIRLSVANVILIRRKDGKYNFEWLLHQRKAQRQAAKKSKMAIKIDRLKLTFGHVIFTDYTVRGDKPLFIRFDINMDKTYSNITSPEDLGKQVSKTIMDSIAVGEIRNFEIKDLPDIARSALEAIPDETKDRIFGPGKDRNKVLKELGHRFMNKIKGEK